MSQAQGKVLTTMLRLRIESLFKEYFKTYKIDKAVEMCTKPEDSCLITRLNSQPVIFSDFKRVMLQPDHSQNDKEAKVDKIILFLTNI
jgi:hypothetical protein